MTMHGRRFLQRSVELYDYREYKDKELRESVDRYSQQTAFVEP
jgi:hypothetical protein